MSPTPSADLLGASSLALGALAVLYSLWAPKIDKALAAEKSRHVADRGPAVRSVREAVRSMALPLMLASCATALVLFPPVVQILCSAGKHTRKLGVTASIKDYDAVQALFVIVWVMLAALAYLAMRQLWALRTRLSELNRAD